jgi:hypothetical protein
LHFGQQQPIHSQRSYNPYASINSVENSNRVLKSNSALAVRDANISKIKEEGEEINNAPKSPRGAKPAKALLTPIPKLTNMVTATSSTLQSLTKGTSSEKKL